MLWKIVISWPTRERISWVVATKVFPLDGRKHRCAEAELTPLTPYPLEIIFRRNFLKQPR